MESLRRTAMDINEERAIRSEIEGFIRAWNAGDVAKAAAFFAADAVRVGAFGDIQHGRDAIAGALDMFLHHTMPGVRLRVQPGPIRMLSPEFALTQGEFEIVLPDGSMWKGYAVDLWEKREGRWLMLESHPKIFPPPLSR
jgi:uncharacterized protein (TIGR02246 family)